MIHWLVQICFESDSLCADFGPIVDYGNTPVTGRSAGGTAGVYFLFL